MGGWLCVNGWTDGWRIEGVGGFDRDDIFSWNYLTRRYLYWSGCLTQIGISLRIISVLCGMDNLKRSIFSAIENKKKNYIFYWQVPDLAAYGNLHVKSRKKSGRGQLSLENSCPNWRKNLTKIATLRKKGGKISLATWSCMKTRSKFGFRWE